MKLSRETFGTGDGAPGPESYIEHIDGTGLVLAALERFKLAHLVQARYGSCGHCFGHKSPHFRTPLQGQYKGNHDSDPHQHGVVTTWQMLKDELDAVDETGESDSLLFE